MKKKTKEVTGYFATTSDQSGSYPISDSWVFIDKE